MKRHFFALLMSLTMIISLLPVTAMAENETQENEAAAQAAETPAAEGTESDPWDISATDEDHVIAYLKQNNADAENPTYTLVISGHGDTRDYAKDADRPWNGNDTITDIVVENGITYMGDRLVQGLAATHISIPASVETISELSLGRMTSLEEIDLDENNASYRMDAGVLFTKDMTTLVKYPALKEGSSYVVPDSVTRLGHHAFSGTANLTELTLPDTLEEIGKYAFAETTGIDTLVIPDSVTKLETSAISGNSGLKRVIIGSGVAAIPESLCYRSKTIEEVMFSGGSRLKAVGTTAFRECTALKKVELPETVETIGVSAFQGCAVLTSVVSADGELPALESIGRQAFRDCGSLTNFKFGSALQTIGDSAFLNCSSLEDVLIDGQITSIGTSAFNGCRSVEKISIVSNTDITIYSSAFANNISAKTICVGSNNGNVTLGDPNSIKGSIASGAEFDVVKFFGNNVLISGESLLSRSVTNAETGKNETANAYSMIDFTGAKSISYSGTYGNKFIWYMRPQNNDGVLYVDSSDAAKALEAVLSGSIRGRLYAVTNGGIFGENATFTAGELTDPSRTGFVFGGWFDNEDCEGAPITGTLNAAPSDTHYKTYYAKWTASPITSIVVTPKENAKFAYGSALSADDFIVTVNYENGDTETLKADDYTISPENLESAGTTTVTVTYKDETGTCDIDVAKAEQDISYATASVSKRVGAANFTNELTQTFVDGAITYTSSDESVAKVDAATGEVTIVGIGRATITATAAETANYNKATASYTLTVTRRYSSSTTVTPEPTPEPTPEETVKFSDVSTSAYYYDAVKWAVENGVTDGVSATLFAPYEPCTRGQIVTFLWRAAGSPEPKTASSFADVPASAYYAKAVAWAVENGITNGMTDTAFAPDATCTRGQSVTFLYRALKGTTGGSTSFTDVPADAFYADAVSWAVANKVTDGTSATTFSPNADCTRAEIVTFLYRADQAK